MNRQRFIILAVFVVLSLGVSGWLITRAVLTSQNTFLGGLPPQDVRSILLPKQVDASQLHPPALSSTDQILYGSPTSVASVIEFGDYECDTCKTTDTLLRKVVASYGGQVRYVWKDFPVYSVHQNALEAAAFAICAGEQGQFWNAHNALLSANGLNSGVYQTISNALHLNTDQISTCKNDPKLRDFLISETDQARSDGLDTAPTIFVGTKAFVGAVTEEEVRAALDAFIKS